MSKPSVQKLSWRQRLVMGAALAALFSIVAPGPMSVPTQAQSSAKKSDEQKRAEDAAMIEKLMLFGDVFARVREEHVEEVPDEDLIAAALNGALHALDPHSSYVPPVAFEEQQVSSRREYGGLGIEVSQELGLVKVQYALEDGPAYKAGIRTGDFITAVEGEKVRGKSLDDAIKGMKGLAGDLKIRNAITPPPGNMMLIYRLSC